MNVYVIKSRIEDNKKVIGIVKMKEDTNYVAYVNSFDKNVQIIDIVSSNEKLVNSLIMVYGIDEDTIKNVMSHFQNGCTFVVLTKYNDKSYSRVTIDTL